MHPVHAYTRASSRVWHVHCARPQVIDELFSEWDKDGGGALNLQELQKILRAPRTPKIAGAMGAAAALGKLGKS